QGRRTMQSIRWRAAVAVATLAVAGSAWAVYVNNIKAMSPQQRAAYFHAMAVMKARGLTSAPGNSLDTTPPVLTGFKLTAPADVAAAFAQIKLDVTATDDLSGVS